MTRALAFVVALLAALCVQAETDAYRSIVAFEAAASKAAASGNFREAADAHGKAIQLAATLNRPRLTAALLQRLGDSLLAGNRIQDAVQAFESGLMALAGDPKLHLDELTARLGAVSKGLPPREMPVPMDLYSESGDRDLATDEADDARAVRLLIGVGNSYLRQPQDAPALNAYQLALQRPEIDRLPRLKAHVLANSGEILRRQGRLDDAERRLKDAVAGLEREGPPLEERRALALLAGIYRDKHQAGPAHEHYAKALALYERAGDRRGEASARTGLGHLWMQEGRCDDAVPEYQRAIALAGPLADTNVLWPAYLGLGRCERARGHLDAASDALAKSYEIVRNRQDDLRTDEGKVGLIESAQDLQDELLKLEMQRAPGNPDSFARLLELTERSRGSALMALMQGWGPRRPTAANFGLPECVAPGAAGSLAVHGTDAPSTPAGGRADHGQARSQAAGNAASSAAGPDDDTPGVPSSTLPRGSLTRGSPLNMAAQMAPSVDVPRSPSSMAAQMAPSVDVPRAPTGMASQMAPSVGVPPSPSTLAQQRAPSVDVPGALPNAAAFPLQGARAPGDVRATREPPPQARLVFVVFDDRTLVLVVGTDGSVSGHVAKIGRDALAQRVAQLRLALDVQASARSVRAAAPRPTPAASGRSAAPVSPSAADFDALSRALYQTLVAPVASRLPPAGETLAIEPHESLWLLPFAALRAGDQWMGERWPLVYAPSGDLLREARSRAPLERSAPYTGLIVGNPVVGAIDAGDDAMFRLGFAPLPGADEEARRIEALFPGHRGKLLRGKAGDLSTVVREASAYDIVHLATHGIARNDDPLASFVLLAPSPCGELLTARRVMTLSLKADLVTLSACQTGLGRVAGEGVLGLSRAFLFAGARSVLVSHWSISDHATTTLMDGFYRRYLDEGMDKAKALQQSMAALRHQPGFEHPRFWAPFFLVGSE